MKSRREFLQGCVSACVGVGFGSFALVNDRTQAVDWKGVDELIEKFVNTQTDLDEYNGFDDELQEFTNAAIEFVETEMAKDSKVS